MLFKIISLELITNNTLMFLIKCYIQNCFVGSLLQTKMAGETDLSKLIQGMTPLLNDGDYVFCSIKDRQTLDCYDTICEFKEKEGTTIVLEKSKADVFELPYNHVWSWITLNIHSSLAAVGLTAIFSSELAKHSISCNIIAGYYHDHIFVPKKDSTKAILVLKNLSKKYK